MTHRVVLLLTASLRVLLLARLSVCLFVCSVRAPSSKTVNRKKAKLVYTFHRAGITGVPVFLAHNGKD